MWNLTKILSSITCTTWAPSLLQELQPFPTSLGTVEVGSSHSPLTKFISLYDFWKDGKQSILSEKKAEVLFSKQAGNKQQAKLIIVNMALQKRKGDTGFTSFFVPSPSLHACFQLKLKKINKLNLYYLMLSY